MKGGISLVSQKEVTSLSLIVEMEKAGLKDDEIVEIILDLVRAGIPIRGTVPDLGDKEGN